MQRFLPYIIRPMAQADIPAVVAIDRMSFPNPWPASSYQYEINENRRSFYYVLLRPSPQDQQAIERPGWRAWLRPGLGTPRTSLVIGYVGLRLEGGHTHISTIAVHPDWRGRGLGEALLWTAIRQTLDLGLARVTLEVRTTNVVAQGLYLKYGFSLIGIERGYYRGGEDAWLMEAHVGGPDYRARLAQFEQVLSTRLRQAPPESGQKADDGV
jgi:ribosomal-protein-alanine N-acetyltransferase